MASSITPSSHLSFGLPLCLLPSNICNKTLHVAILRSSDLLVGRSILDSPAIASLDFATMLCSGAGCQPCVQPPAILEDQLDCFLVWVFITDQSGVEGPTSSYTTASIAPWLIRPHKPKHRQGHAISRWGTFVLHYVLCLERFYYRSVMYTITHFYLQQHPPPT